AEGQGAKQALAVAVKQEIGRRKQDEEGRRLEGGHLIRIEPGNLVEQNRRHQRARVGDGQRPHGQRDTGQPQQGNGGRIQRKERDQVAEIAGGGIAVPRQVEVVVCVPLAPLEEHGGRRVGGPAGRDQGGQDDQQL